VAEFLFVSYMNAGEAATEQDVVALADVRQALAHFSNALAIHPRNRAATEARRLSSIYFEALQAVADGNDEGARVLLQGLLSENAGYAGGTVARQLYALLLRQADAAMLADDVEAAIRLYQEAQTIGVSDTDLAVEGEAVARARPATPSPQPTALGTPAPAAPRATLRSGQLNLRAGPGTTFPVISQIPADQPLTVTGRNGDGTWLQICCIDGRSGWAIASRLQYDQPLPDLPLVQATQGPSPAAGAYVVATPAPIARPAATVAPSGQGMVCVTGRLLDVRGGQPLANWGVILTPIGMDPAEGAPSERRTDGEGRYLFDGLPAGQYTISEILPAGWTAISPPQELLTLAASAECHITDFWNENNEAAGSTEAGPTPVR